MSVDLLQEIDNFYGKFITMNSVTNDSFVFDVIPITLSNYKEVSKFIATNFKTYEQLYSSSGVSIDFLSAEKYDKICLANVFNKMGCVFYNRVTKTIVCVITFQDANNRISTKSDSRYGKYLNDIEDILSNVKLEKYPEESLIFQTINVHPFYMSRGLSSQMLRYCLERHPLINKAKYIFSECLNEVSLNILRKLNFRILGEYNYDKNKKIYSVVRENVPKPKL